MHSMSGSGCGGIRSFGDARAEPIADAPSGRNAAGGVNSSAAISEAIRA
jgi:hypothetical protein